MPYNRYRGNSGRVERVEDVRTPQRIPSGSPLPELPRPQPPPGGKLGRSQGAAGELSKLLRRLSPANMETEDILLLLILYLLYRESGNRDFLIMIAGLVFF